jgi:NADPH:quinone reductase-like Zn-dependent oxidoreductase
LVKVHAASVNPKDWKLNRSLALVAGPLGRRLLPPLFGDDLAGEVVAVGADVREFAVGDRVYGMDMRLRTASLAEFAVIDERRIARMPATADYAEAAAMPLAAQTALQGLRQAGASRLPRF